MNAPDKINSLEDCILLTQIDVTLKALQRDPLTIGARAFQTNINTWKQNNHMKTLLYHAIRFAVVQINDWHHWINWATNMK